MPASERRPHAADRLRRHAVAVAVFGGVAVAPAMLRAQVDLTPAGVIGALSPTPTSSRFLLQPRLHLEQGLQSSDEVPRPGNTHFFTRATIGVGLRSNAGLLRGSLDYDGGFLTDWGSSYGTQIENTLRARLTAEVVPRQVFVDVDATSRRVANSPLGPQPSYGYGHARGTQFSSARIAPRWQPSIGTDRELVVSPYYQRQWAPGSYAGGLEGRGGAVHFLQRGRLVGLGLDAVADRTDYLGAYSTSDRRLFGTLLGRVPGADLTWQVHAGRERFDPGLQGTATEAATWGGGLDWRPSNRTHASLRYDRRAYGPTHSIVLDYRAPLWLVSLRDTRALNTGGAITVPGRAVSLFDLTMAQTAALEPDPLRRTALVLAVLRQFGLDPTTITTTPGFLAPGQSMLRSTTLTAGLRGARSALSLTYLRSRSEQLTLGNASLNPLYAYAARYQTRGLTLDGSYRVDAVTSLNAGVSWNDASSTDVLTQGAARSHQLGLSGGLSVALSSRATAGVLLRRIQYEGANVPGAFDNLLSATYDMRF